MKVRGPKRAGNLGGGESWPRLNRRRASRCSSIVSRACGVPTRPVMEVVGIMRIGLVLVAVALLASGCGILDIGGDVEVRVRNNSGVLLDEVTLLLPRETVTYSELAPSQSSPYVAVEKAYRIATVEVVAAQDTARLQVIDYVGETPLKAGRYTYVLLVFGTDPLSIGLDFQKDS